jgi:hypothetical protein
MNATVIMVLALICGLGLAAQDMNLYPLPADNPQVKSAANYILSCQNADGGFGSASGEESGLIPTCEAIMSLTALNENLSHLKQGNPLHYLLANEALLANLSNVEAQTGRFAVALATAGVNPHNASGRDYAAILKSYSKPSGGIGKVNYIWDDAWVILGLAAAGESHSEQVSKAVQFLKSTQTPSGGWAWDGGSKGEDPDTTSIIICALMAAGENSSSEVIQNGLRYLRSEQNEDGGFSSQGSNAATDGWGILAIRATGQNPREWKRGSADPVSHLLSLQGKDGSFWWKKDTQGMTFEWTANGIVALEGGALPAKNFLRLFI